MKKISICIFLILLFCVNAIADTNDSNIKLDKLFEQLKKSYNVNVALEIEMKIWDIWSTHPTKIKLTQALEIGSDLMSKGKLDEAYKIHYQIAPAIDLIFEEGNPAGIKAVFKKLGLAEDYVRLPLVEATENLSAKISAFVDKIK
jgi:hypothetical protein